MEEKKQYWQYERLKGYCIDITKSGEVFTCIFAHTDYFSIGTNNGNIYLLSTEGKLINKHTASGEIKDIFIDNSGRYISFITANGKVGEFQPDTEIKYINSNYFVDVFIMDKLNHSMYFGCSNHTIIHYTTDLQDIYIPSVRVIDSPYKSINYKCGLLVTVQNEYLTIISWKQKTVIFEKLVMGIEGEIILYLIILS